MQRVDYAGEADLRRMQELVRRTWRPGGRYHVGDLGWRRLRDPDVEAQLRTSLWEDGDELVGWAWVAPDGEADVLLDDAHLDRLGEVLDWCDQALAESGPAGDGAPDGSAVDTLAVTVMDRDPGWHSALKREGFTADNTGPFHSRYVRDLVALPRAPLPEGYKVARVRLVEAGRRAAALRAASGGVEDGAGNDGSAGSGVEGVDVAVTQQGATALMRTPPYRPECDLVVVSPAGEWVASAMGWYDEVNHVGLLEPVATRPDERGRGLARAVTIAALKALRDLGAKGAVALPRSDPGYPGPARLALSCGFRRGPRTVRYVRQRTRP